MEASTPTPSPEEEALLEVVAAQLAVEGVVLGEWLYEPAPLTVDFVFEDATPEPVVIELTSLVDPTEMAGTNAMVRYLTDPLNELAREQGWGSWLLHVDMPAPYKPLARLVTELIRGGHEIRDGGYSSDELQRARDDGTLDELLAKQRVSAEAGIIFLIRIPDDGDAVGVGGQSVGMRSIDGFTIPLLNTVYGKESQLAAARPRRTHLAINVVRWDFSRDANETLPPPLPEAIDRLWVLHRWANKRDLPNLWWVERGAPEWAKARVELP